MASGGTEDGHGKPKTRVHLSSNGIAGVAAGFTSCVATHPLDVVKTRFQVRRGMPSHVESKGVKKPSVQSCALHDGMVPEHGLATGDSILAASIAPHDTS
jgi:hypothetical protein